MPNQVEDRWSKYVLGRVLSAVATVETGADLLPDVFRVDTMFCAKLPLQSSPPGAGLLWSWVGERRCVVEPYSGSVKDADIHASLAKLQLSLYRWHQDKTGPENPQGCLVITTTYWPRQGLHRILGVPDEVLEKGVWHWKRGLETVYVVNACQIGLREETLLFRLLGKGKTKREALVKVIREQIEPYATLMDNFTEEFKEMAGTEQIKTISPERLEEMLAELQEIQNLRSEVALEKARKEAREKAREEGREEGREEESKQMLLRMLQKKFPGVKNWGAMLEQIPGTDALEPLFEEILDIDDARQMQRRVKAAAQTPSVQ